MLRQSPLGRFACLCFTLCLTTGAAHAAEPVAFQSDWQVTPDRVWIGPEYWANPMEDWRVQQGRLESSHPGGNRNVHLLTRQLGEQAGDLTMTVEAGFNGGPKQRGSVGFRLGAKMEIDDYRAAALFGAGVNCGLTSDGVLFLDGVEKKLGALAGPVELKLTAQPQGAAYQLTLAARDLASGRVLGEVVRDNVAAQRLVGNLALVQNQPNRHAKQSPTCWFRDWQLSGTKLVAHDDRAWGPILWAMHSLSRDVLKMTAQIPPLGAGEDQTVRLQIQTDGAWKTVAEAPIDKLACTATVRVENWDSTRDTPYRLAYTSRDKSGKATEHFYTGTVRRDPVDRDLVLAGFTGNTDFGFPNRELVRNLEIQNPDVLFFSGDQIYEGVGGYGIVRAPTERAVLNYLRKWYLFGWAFGDLMRDRVALCLPDDHDVYQPNVWGNGGNPLPNIEAHDEGGYVQDKNFINVVHRTHTAHHPDPFDPTPIKQGISSYYGDMVYGRVSFAILADRMFKSGPKQVATWPGRPDHVSDPKIDMKALDKPGLELLGERQHKFLEHWAGDWRGADLKCVLSQTIFVNLANYHGEDKMYLIADLDSNGWPQSQRDEAVRLIRKSFALHVAGDQHLASLVRYGVDDWNDAGFALCVPSIAAGYPRSWQPDKEGVPVQNRPAPGLANTGEYREGLGNLVTVYGVGNPAEQNRRGRIATLHDKASGHGIVRFHRDAGKYTIECYRLLFNAANPQPEDQFPGWPRTITLHDNYARAAQAHLPTLQITGLDRPVLKVINPKTSKLVYALRLPNPTFQPKVFAPGPYTLEIGDPDQETWQTLENIHATPDNKETLEVKFPKP